MAAEPAHAPHLHVVGCADCEQLRKALENARVDVENAGVDLVAKRREIGRLELMLTLMSDPMYPTALPIFEYWRIKCDHPRAGLTAERLGALLARLRERTEDDEPKYTPRYICEAIVGAHVAAFVRDGRRYDDLELICRSGQKLDDFHERWERYRAKQDARTAA